MIEYEDLLLLIGLGMIFFGLKGLPQWTRALVRAMRELKKGVAVQHKRMPLRGGPEAPAAPENRLQTIQPGTPPGRSVRADTAGRPRAIR